MKPRRKWRKYRRPGNGKGGLLTEAELARKLGEVERTIRNWRYKGLIPYLKLGHKTIRYRLDAVLAALEKKTVRKRYFYSQPL
jgi:predicted site-specific integrase-resolvase